MYNDDSTTRFKRFGVGERTCENFISNEKRRSHTNAQHHYHGAQTKGRRSWGVRASFPLFLFAIWSIMILSTVVKFSDPVSVENLEDHEANEMPSQDKRLNQINQISKNGKKRQRICILAGPHKTGTSSLQTNLYRWSKETVKFAAAKLQPLPDPIIKWVWPVPSKIAEVEYSDTKAWGWTPSKAFYPMVEVLRDKKKDFKSERRALYKKFTSKEILGMYKETIQSYWSKGYDIVFGSEAMDLIVKVPEGPSMIRNMNAHVLPDTVNGDQVTVVVVYRTPKIKHLVSVWHQNCVTPSPDNKFHQWITTTDNTLGALDALGMVDIFLNETDWNVALIDLDGVKQDGYDISNFVACEIMGEDCEAKRLKGLYGNDPIVTNVRGDKRPPNVPNQTLDEMNLVLNSFDCNYQHLLDQMDERLTIYYPEELKKVMKDCETMNVAYPRSRQKMKRQIKDIALKYGVLW
jgi:hypothetical protein